jgi:hypothetical protein
MDPSLQSELAARLGKPWEALAPGVREILQRSDARTTARDPEAVKYFQAHGLTPEGVEWFMTQVAKGAQYVYEKFGMDIKVPHLQHELILPSSKGPVSYKEYRFAYVEGRDQVYINPKFMRTACAYRDNVTKWGIKRRWHGRDHFFNAEESIFL